jgi:hypothetical protein
MQKTMQTDENGYVLGPLLPQYGWKDIEKRKHLSLQKLQGQFCILLVKKTHNFFKPSSELKIQQLIGNDIAMTVSCNEYVIRKRLEQLDMVFYNMARTQWSWNEFLKLLPPLRKDVSDPKDILAELDKLPSATELVKSLQDENILMRLRILTKVSIYFECMNLQV